MGKIRWSEFDLAIEPIDYDEQDRLEKEREDEEEWSNCCGARPLLPTCDGMGICSHCKENAVFNEEEE